MHIAAIPNRSARPTFLLRKSARKGKHVTSEALTNLSELSIAQIEAMRRVLKGEKLGPHGGDFECTGSKLHGHVDAVRTAMARLGFDKLIDAKASRSRGLVAAMAAARIIAPTASKLGIVGASADTTLADDLGLHGVDEDELYAAMDWLLERQPKIAIGSTLLRSQDSSSPVQ